VTSEYPRFFVAAMGLVLSGCVTYPDVVRSVDYETGPCGSGIVVETCDMRTGPFTHQWVNCRTVTTKRDPLGFVTTEYR
jgi:hypothetical protein